jgi:hypothetical protein
MKEKNPLLIFFVGAALLAAGLYWLFNSVEVSSNWWGGYYSIGSAHLPTGMVIVPLLVGVFWAIVKPESFLAKICIVVGMVVIIASIIASVKFTMRQISLYSYAIMLVMIVAGAGLLARVLLFGDGNNKENKK